MTPAAVTPVTEIREVRCACTDCGAHYTAWQGLRSLGGSCGNCGSYDGILLTGADPVGL